MLFYVFHLDQICAKSVLLYLLLINIFWHFLTFALRWLTTLSDGSRDVYANTVTSSSQELDCVLACFDSYFYLNLGY